MSSDPRNYADRRGGVFKNQRGERVRDESAKQTTPVVPGVDVAAGKPLVESKANPLVSGKRAGRGDEAEGDSTDTSAD